MTGVLTRRGNLEAEGRRCEDTGGMALYKPRGGASEETNPAHTLVSDFRPPEPRANQSLSFKLPGQWYFVPQPELTGTLGWGGSSEEEPGASMAARPASPPDR